MPEAASDEAFLKAFEDCTLPSSEWHHRAHLKVAYLYLNLFPFDEALNRIRERIKRYNAATNTPENLERGYHETITQAWLRLIHAALCEFGPAASADEFLDAQPQLLTHRALRFFYSREQLVSQQAKAVFVEPDLAPLPRSSRQGGYASMTKLF